MISEMQVARLVAPREQRELGKGRAAVDQGTAEIVADAAEH
jgi:hypothetical protein